MPHYDIRLRIVCGETTCAVAAGRFCDYYSEPRGGHNEKPPTCVLFRVALAEGPGGWIMRAPACIAASTPAEKPKGSA